jgi:hypothetical protein
MMKNSTGLVWHAALALGFVLMPGCSRAPAARIIYHDEQGLWRMTPEGKDIHPLASSGVDGEYSPDNTQIAFSKFYNAGSGWLTPTERILISRHLSARARPGRRMGNKSRM